MATPGWILAPIALRAFKHALQKTSNLIKARLAETSRPFNQELQPVLVRKSPRLGIQPIARIRQAKARRSYLTITTINAAIRRYASSSTEYANKYTRSTFPTSSTATAVARLTSRAPFASTLRPNLTGGAFPRSAGGYSLGGGRATGARYFSHIPTAPAQVIHNVSAAIRAFCISGQRAHFDGTTAQGEKKYRVVSRLHEETAQKIKRLSRPAPGSFIDFPISPVITALTPPPSIFPFEPKAEIQSPSLNTEGLLDCLAIDFSRALKDLAMTMNDLKRLAALGDLPISLESKSLRVRFPGCDIETAERLCDEVGVQRGVVSQDSDFGDYAGAQLALMFPFAPSQECTLSSPGGSLRSQTGLELYDNMTENNIENPWLEDSEIFNELRESESESASSDRLGQHPHSSDFEGLEGIYRFLEQCDNARRI